MDSIARLDEQLSTLFENFSATTREITMEDICDLRDEATIAQQSYQGIYRIDVATSVTDLDSKRKWINSLRSEWEHADFINKRTPKFQQSRAKKHQEQLGDWTPLYLGKSKNVGKRVLQHIHLELGKTTSALKLMARRSMENRIFRLHALRLELNNYDLIAPALEKELRDRFNPLIGKQ